MAYLYLRDGMCDGKRILRRDGPRPRRGRSSRPASIRRRTARYGYQWWLLPHTTEGRYAYAAIGYGGQLAIVVPELDLIAVFTGWNIYDQPTLSPQLARSSACSRAREEIGFGLGLGAFELRLWALGWL